MKDQKKKKPGWLSIALYIVLALLIVYLLRGRVVQMFADASVKKMDISDLRLTDTSGDTWQLSSLEGRCVLLVFWASWCGPCKMEIPQLNGLHQKYPDDLVILGINSGENRETIENAVIEHAIQYPVIRDQSGRLTDKFSVSVLPTIIEIDRKGSIHAISHGFNPTLPLKISKLIEM
jgi:thiol-disulfide isomerase/thioredoxin